MFGNKYIMIGRLLINHQKANNDVTNDSFLYVGIYNFYALQHVNYASKKLPSYCYYYSCYTCFINEEMKTQRCHIAG